MYVKNQFLKDKLPKKLVWLEQIQMYSIIFQFNSYYGVLVYVNLLDLLERLSVSRRIRVRIQILQKKYEIR